MSWKIKAGIRDILARETGEHPKEPGARLSVALIWPGTYHTGMSALGYMSIYSLLNGIPGVTAERFFLPNGPMALEYEKTGQALLSLETSRPLSAFEIAAGSLSLENDYWLFLKILNLSGLPIKSEERREPAPLIIAGGVAVWANPWPLRPFADLILTGEAEAQWPQLISAWDEIRHSSLPKPDRVRHLCRKTPGALPSGVAAEPLPDNRQGFSVFMPAVSPARLEWPPPEHLLPPVSPILTPDTEFANAKLVEISRGCPYGCRFCLAGVIFRPHRPWPASKILAALGPPEAPGEKVGLVSPAAADHPEIDDLLGSLLEQKRQVALSSLRLTAITPALAAKLAAGQLHGAAIAPEGGSQRLRDVINKELTEEMILNASRLLAEAGLKKIKLYFIIGLPGETDDDLNALIDLCTKIRAAARHGRAVPELLVSLANFTPKPHTPFEDAPMNTSREFKRKGSWVAKGLKSVPRLSVNLDPPLWSIVQGLLAKGGPESGQLTEVLYEHNGKLKPALADIGYRDDHRIHKAPDEAAWRPWRVVVPAAGFEYLSCEKERAKQTLTSPPCPAGGHCHRCLACGEVL